MEACAGLSATAGFLVSSATRWRHRSVSNSKPHIFFQRAYLFTIFKTKRNLSATNVMLTNAITMFSKVRQTCLFWITFELFFKNSCLGSGQTQSESDRWNQRDEMPQRSRSVSVYLLSEQTLLKIDHVYLVTCSFCYVVRAAPSIIPLSLPAAAAVTRLMQSMLLTCQSPRVNDYLARCFRVQFICFYDRNICVRRGLCSALLNLDDEVASTYTISRPY